VNVPGVHHDSVRTRVVNEDRDLFVVRLRLGEGVIQNDVDGVLDRHGRVEFGDDYSVAVLVEHVGHTHHHHVVVVDEGDRDWSIRAGSHAKKVPP
jgi:hypothetical protein